MNFRKDQAPTMPPWVVTLMLNQQVIMLAQVQLLGVMSGRPSIKETQETLLERCEITKKELQGYGL